MTSSCPGLLSSWFYNWRAKYHSRKARDQSPEERGMVVVQLARGWKAAPYPATSGTLPTAKRDSMCYNQPWCQRHHDQYPWLARTPPTTETVGFCLPQRSSSRATAATALHGTGECGREGLQRPMPWAGLLPAPEGQDWSRRSRGAGGGGDQVSDQGLGLGRSRVVP